MMNYIISSQIKLIANQTKIVAYRRLCFFGHIARLYEKTPAKVALYEAIRPVKDRRGIHQTLTINNKTTVDGA